ncbi:GTPase domain-containing protein [Catellatospora sp. KI3]|uniref:GTPase n=1 Tax=Catellatospora sp. KI3 TaxID=3041620 RepID=UPI002482BBFD|nr:GTPase domain-containing protein [Catellatospora sp. KI3]MDI1461357.1 GTPase domain-containing protein [Catellatospora sp. KI3]
MSTRWVQRLREAVEAATGSQTAVEADQAWRQAAESGTVRVTLVGPWSAGKSSLIKRLLVEDGSPVPQWLTVSASRETYEIQQARSAGLTYVDTPGLGSDERRHDQLALSSVAATDLLVVAVTPQLLGTDVDRLAALVDGTAITPYGGRFFPPGALVVVIAKADMAGVDPIDDLDGFRAMADRKRASVVTALRRLVPGELPPVIAVVADLGGQHARNPNPSAAAFAEGRDWDGVHELRAVLAAADASRLRAAAHVRHWARTGALALEQATAALTQSQDRQRRLRADRSRVLVLEEELAAIDSAAATRLRDDIRDEMHSVIMQGEVDSTEQLVEQITDRVNTCVAAWHAESTSKLVALARRAQVELTPAATGPGGPAAGPHVERLVKQAAAPAAGGLDAQLSEFVAKGLLVADKMQELRLGVNSADIPHHLNEYQSLVDRVHPDAYARTLSLLGVDGVLTDPRYAGELASLQKHEGVGELIAYLRKPGGITSPAHAEKLKNTAHTLRIAADVAPVLLELVRMQQQERASQHLRDKRAHLQVQADGAATRQAEQILANSWRGQVAELRTALRAGAPDADALALAERQSLELGAARDTLDSVLRELAAATTFED